MSLFTGNLPKTDTDMHPQMHSAAPGLENILGNPIRPSVGAVPFPNSMQPKDLALANSMQGMIDDQRAVAQETKKVLQQLGGLATRLTQMMGDGRSGYSDIGSSVTKAPDPNGGILLTSNRNSLGIGPTPMIHASHAHVAYVPIPGTSAAADPFMSSPNYQNQQNQSNSLVTAAPQPSVNNQGVSSSPGQSSWDYNLGKEKQTLEQIDTRSSGGQVQQAPDPNKGGGGKDTLENLETPAIVAAGLLHKNFKKGQSMQGLASELKNKGTFKGIPGVGKFLYGTEGTPAIAATAASTAADGTIIPAVEGAAEVAGTAGAIGGVAEGGGILASAGGALMGSAAGPIGLGAGALFGAYKFGGDFLSHERAAGATFQSMEGGTNLQGQAERARQAEFGATQWGSLTGGQANKLFQGVTGLGWTGGQRQAGLDFATSNYRSMGMDPNESMTLLTSIAQNGAVNLNKLALSLQNVTSTAAAASLNTDQVRQSFAATFTALQGAGVGAGAPGGGGAGALATAVTNVISGMGPTVQRSGATQDLSSPDAMTRQAAVMGKTPGEWQAITRGPDGGNQIAIAQNKIYAQVLPSIQASTTNWSQLQQQFATDGLKPGQLITNKDNSILNAVANATPGGAASELGFLKAMNAPGADLVNNDKNTEAILEAYANALSGGLSGNAPNSLPNANNAANKAAADAAAKAAADAKLAREQPWTSKLDNAHMGNDLKSWGANAIASVEGLPALGARILSGQEMSGVLNSASSHVGHAISDIGHWFGGGSAGATEPNAGAQTAPSGYTQGSDGKWYPASGGSSPFDLGFLKSLGTSQSPPTSSTPKPPTPTPPPKVNVVLSWKDPAWGAKINALISQTPTNANQVPANPFLPT